MKGKPGEGRGRMGYLVGTVNGRRREWRERPHRKLLT